MTDMQKLYLLVPLAPLFGAVIAGLFGKYIGRAGAHWITIIGVAISFYASVLVFQDVLAGHTFNGSVYTWLTAGETRFEIGFLIDKLTVMMMLVVTFVSLMVHIYTIGYMHDDPGYQRFFSYISLFTFSMLMLVMANNFLLMFLGWAIFGNPIGKRRIYASIVGFAGAMLVIQPSLDHYGLVALFPLGCALSFSVYEMATQAMSNRIHPVTMQLHTSIAGALICLPLLWLFNGSGLSELDPVTPDALNWLWMFGVGFWAAISHLSMTVAMKYAPASTLAPLHYLELPMAVFLGYAIFGDFPNWLTWCGIGLITGSGLYIILHEHSQATAHPMPPPLPNEAI